MTTLNSAYLNAVLAVNEAPCISIYLPTHRNHPDNATDPIRFKNLVKQVEDSLKQGYSNRDIQPLMESLHQLHDNAAFWNHTLDGVAVLASATRLDVFNLPRTMPEIAVVADSFHIKPLLRHVQSADRFQVLAIAEDKHAIFEGNRYLLTEMRVPKMSGAIRAPASSDPRGEVVVGEGIEGYFRVVDRSISHDVSKVSGVPLVLAALPENLSAFLAVAKNPSIVPEAITDVDPFALSVDELRSRAWAILEPYYLARLAKLTEDFGTAFSKWQGTGDLSDAAQAAIAGRIGILMIEADRVYPGKIDPVTGAITTHELADPKVDDKLDDLAEMVLKTGGEVVIVPAERMPTQTGLAAIFRY